MRLKLFNEKAVFVLIASIFGLFLVACANAELHSLHEGRYKAGDDISAGSYTIECEVASEIYNSYKDLMGDFAGMSEYTEGLFNFYGSLVDVPTVSVRVLGSFGEEIKKFEFRTGETKDLVLSAGDILEIDGDKCTCSLTPQADSSTDGSSSYDGEILFRGVSWGVDYVSLTRSISEIKFKRAGWGTNLSLHYLEHWYFPDIGIESTQSSIIYCDDDSNVTVAGYETERIELYFATYPDSSGTIDNENDLLTSFFGAEYVFKTDGLDLKRAELDLTSKLSGIYGEPSLVKLDTDWLDDSRNRYVWKGKNDTYAFLLVYHDHSGDSSDGAIYLKYIWGKGDELIKVADDILMEKVNLNATPPPYETDNIDGL